LCRWLQQRQVAIDRCTKTELGEYLATIESFRAGPRLACEGTVTALVDFLGARATSSAFSAIEAR
jgi:hypothetical protein